MNLQICSSLRDRIRMHAEADYPQECCGFLSGNDCKVSEVAAARNVASEHEQKDRYQADPAAQLRIQREARANGLRIIGCYHSHPDDDAIPTSVDLAHAWPEFIYLIVSVKDGRAVDARGWMLTADAPSRFEELALCTRQT